jgi:hypothetical protein
MTMFDGEIVHSSDERFRQKGAKPDSLPY